MSYIGRQPTVGNFQVCDAISVVNNQAAYTMQVGGVNVSPETANHMLVSLNGILQAPTSSFTVSGSTITFASNLVTGDVINFIQILGSVLDLGVPSDSTVSLAKLTATGTKNSTTFLRGDNTFAAAGGGKVLQVITATDSTQRATTSTSYTKASNSLDVVITPAATSSKLLLMYTGEFASDGSTVTIVTIFRNTTNLETSSGAGFRARNEDNNSGIAITHLDSPSSTSELTYSIQFRGNSGGQARLESNSRPASFTVMEIGA